jgi:shikimate dehydrogenase
MRLYGLIGKPLTHSFSKIYFSEKFSLQSISDCQYENFELDKIELLKDLIQSHSLLKGLNVTIPYKEAVLPYLYEQNDVVKAVNACNCIKIVNGKLHGFNTDVFGFRESLKKVLQMQHTRALILGTGGAAKAVAYALSELDINFQFISRKDDNQSIPYQDVGQEIIELNTLLINTTPLGMYPNINTFPDIPYEYITDKHLLFDLTYNPGKTRFLEKGEERGATIQNGYEMLILQAEESWRIWNS